MGITSLVRQFNRVVVDAQEESAVWILRRFTKDEAAERFIRYEMDAVREFGVAHPIPFWAPFLFPSVGRGQVIVDMLTENLETFKVAQAAIDISEPRVMRPMVEADMESLRRLLWERQRKRGFDIPLPSIEQFIQELEEMDTADLKALGMEMP